MSDNPIIERPPVTERLKLLVGEDTLEMLEHGILRLLEEGGYGDVRIVFTDRTAQTVKYTPSLSRRKWRQRVLTSELK